MNYSSMRNPVLSLTLWIGSALLLLGIAPSSCLAQSLPLPVSGVHVDRMTLTQLQPLADAHRFSVLFEKAPLVPSTATPIELPMALIWQQLFPAKGTGH